MDDPTTESTPEGGTDAAPETGDASDVSTSPETGTQEVSSEEKVEE